MKEDKYLQAEGLNNEIQGLKRRIEEIDRVLNSNHVTVSLMLLRKSLENQLKEMEKMFSSL